MKYEHQIRPDDPQKLEYLALNNIVVGDSKIQGRGVFSLRELKKGDIIERCPLLELGNRSKYQLDPVIFGYSYAQPLCGCYDCDKHGFVMHLALGYGMLYNHQDDPNALWKFNYAQLLGDVIAVKDIKSGEEIFVNYGNCYFDSDEIETGKQKI